MSNPLDKKWLFVAEVAIGDLASTLASKVDVDWQESSPPRIASFVRCIVDRFGWPQSFELLGPGHVLTAVLYTAEFRCPGLYGCELRRRDDGSTGCAALLRVDVLADKLHSARLFRTGQHGEEFVAPSSAAIDHFVDFQSTPAGIHAPGDYPALPINDNTNTNNENTQHTHDNDDARANEPSMPSTSRKSFKSRANRSKSSSTLGYEPRKKPPGPSYRQSVLANPHLSAMQQQALLELPLPSIDNCHLTTRRNPSTSPLNPAEVIF